MGTGATIVVDGIIGGNTSLITSAFTSVGSLIASPIGGLIIFGLAVSYLFYVKNMAKVNNTVKNANNKAGARLRKVLGMKKFR